MGIGVLEPFCLWSLAASRCLRPPLLFITLSFFCGQKEILQHILHYIQYLQRNIDVAKALLKFHTTNGEGEAGGKSVSQGLLPKYCSAGRDPDDFNHSRPSRITQPHMGAKSEEGVWEDCRGKSLGAGPLRTVEGGALPNRRNNLSKRAGMRRHVWNVWGQPSRWVWLEGPCSIERTSAGS